MPYEFQGENLVYVEPPEVAGFTYKQTGGFGGDTEPQYTWVKNENFDPNSLITGTKDQYGRVDYSLKPNATEAEKRAYDLSFGGANLSSQNITPDNMAITGQNIRNSGWWNIDPAIQAQIEAEYTKNSGNAVGMSGFKDWVVPLSILAAGAGAAIGGGALAGEAALGAGAGEAGGLTTSEILGSNFAGSNFAIDPLASYTPGITGAEIYSNPTTQQMINFANARPDPIQALTELQSMTPSELSTALGSGAGSNFLSGASNALKTAGQVSQGVGLANTIARLASPSTGVRGGTSNANLSQLASLLRPQAQTNDYLGQYKMNQNPFLFTPQGQTVASEGMYDVSGSNPMANALRKA